MKKGQPALIVMTVISIAAIAVLIANLMSHNIDLPSVVLPATPTDSGQEGNILGEILDQEIKPSAVSKLVEKLPKTNNYRHDFIVNKYSDDITTTIEYKVWARDDSFKIVENKVGLPNKNILIKDEITTIWYSDNVKNQYRGRPGTGLQDYFQSLVIYEELVDIPSRQIKRAGFVDRGGPCMYIEYTYGAFSYVNVAYINVDAGYVKYAETYDGERLIYSMESTTYDPSSPDDSVFVLPSKDAA